MKPLLDEWHELSEEELAAPSWRPEFRSVAPRPFDLESCVSLYVASLPARVSTSTLAHKTDLWIRDWCEGEDCILSGLLSVEEARWWFLACTLPERLTDDRETHASKTRVASFDVHEELSVDAVRNRLLAFVSAADQHFTRWPRSFLAPCARAMSYFSTTDEALGVLLDLFGVSRVRPFLRYLPADPAARTFVSSWLDSVDRGRFEVRDLVELARFAPTESGVDLVMDEAIRRGKREDQLDLARAHPDPERFVDTLLKFRRPRWTAPRIRECLARSGFARFDEIALGVSRARPADQREAIEVLSRMHTRRIVDGMLRLSQKGVVRPRARRWLNDEGPNAIHRLIELATSRKKIRGPAREILRGYVLDGRGELVLEVASRFDESVERKIKSLVDEHSNAVRPELPPSMQSGWFAALAQAGDEPMAKLADHLPELSTRDGYRLGREITAGLLVVLSQVSLETRSDGIHDRFDVELTRADERLDPDSAATFSRALFETWVRDQNPAAERWKLFAAGFVHGPATLEFLGDALLRYTRWMTLEDAPFALDTLRAIGSARALYEIEHVRQRTRNGRIREHAERVLEAMAERERVTTAAMLDRALDQIGFEHDSDDARGSRRDQRLRGRIDDTLAHRLEEAMALGSTWQPMTWRNYFVDSAGGGRVSRLLVWQLVDSSGELDCMRIDESGEAVGIDDAPVDVSEWHRVAVAHPATLPSSELREWNERFAQYEIVQPFLQLNRTVYRREALSQGFRAPSGRFVDGVDLWNVLRRNGWQAIRLGSNRIGGFERRFETRKTLARLEIDGPFDLMSMRRGGLASRRTTLERVAFFDIDTGAEIDGAYVHPVVFSESHLDVQNALVRLEA